MCVLVNFYVLIVIIFNLYFKTCNASNSTDRVSYSNSSKIRCNSSAFCEESGFLNHVCVDNFCECKPNSNFKCEF